ncbi:hypothetical protein A3709_07025 [Halioglobus sp. HI00S01]|uniref:glucokinase n=1 Tax=Halioglobus sp. HI00S01 TaxID=1822214 RepID=UPI0007C3F245|nr:glucokinase [Halioglobus sp. HI00S01]KZX56131.1 hypothetical protein A3709_07025 [Halioglobus sp. HI00S01]
MPHTRLVADVGGTNTRIGIYDADINDFRSVTGYSNNEYGNLEEVIEQWLGDLEEAPPQQACIAAAAPPSGDRVQMINIGWGFSCSELATRFGFSQFLWLNDFQANAHALPYLGSGELEGVQAGETNDELPLAVVGPGTGLGGASLRQVNGIAVASDAEPGHAGLSPGNELELAIFQHLLPQYGNIYTELFVCGAGLARLYQTIAQINGQPVEDLTPAQVSERALAGSDSHCVTALETFCALLGSCCGDFVLSNGAYGGLFIAGGIVPRITPYLRESAFLERFRAKGAMQEFLSRVPVQIITAPHPGLVGAAHAPIQE